MKLILIMMIMFLVGCAHTHKPVHRCSFGEIRGRIVDYDSDKLTGPEMQLLAGDVLTLCQMQETSERVNAHWWH